jgi:release factor glutamine methyltransferase
MSGVKVGDALVGCGLPRHEAERLLAVATGRRRGELTPQALISEAEWLHFRQLCARRLHGDPLQYLEGSAPFGPLELVVDSRVLIPRPETEQLAELAVRAVPLPAVVVDLGAGSGALALYLKHRHPGARVLAVDISAQALEVARLNGQRLGLTVEWLEGDLFDPLPRELRGGVSLVVSNPPYVAEREWEELPEDVRREPRQALVAGPLGTEVLGRIAAEVGEWLAPDGVVVCEIGETQGKVASAHFRRAGLRTEVRRDLTGRDRFLLGFRV